MPDLAGEQLGAAGEVLDRLAMWSAVRDASSVALATVAVLASTLRVPSAARCALPAISPVAAFCCSTAPASSRRCRDLGDGGADIPDRGDRLAGGGLDLLDLAGDFLGGFAGLGGELDLARHHGKAAAGFARARRLDRGIQRQKVGLLGNAGISSTMPSIAFEARRD